MHSPQTQSLARGLPVHSVLHAAVLHPHSKPSQPASHWQTEQLHAPWPLQVWPRPSSGHATMLSLQKAPEQPVPVGQTQAAHSHVPALAAHAPSHAAPEHSHDGPLQPASQRHEPQSQSPLPAHCWPLPASGQGEKDSLQCWPE
jgi:hypothetical protein